MPSHLWTVTDKAGNTASRTVTYAVSSPGVPRLRFGMAAGDLAEFNLRLGQIGPNRIFTRRVYGGSSWNQSLLMSRIQECLSAGFMPYASIKSGGTVASWSTMRNGGNDAQIDALGAAIAALPAGTKVRLGYHHEPRPATLSELAIWGQAHTRFNTRIKAIAGAKAVVGPCDNGHPWSDQSFAHLSDAELLQYYPDSFVQTCDAIGADFYDGETDTNAGEPAWPKLRGFGRYWRNTRGFTGQLDAGEWNFIEPEDAGLFVDQMIAFNVTDACVFNDDANNRPDLPTNKGLGNPPKWIVVPGTPRMTALQAAADRCRTA